MRGLKSPLRDYESPGCPESPLKGLESSQAGLGSRLAEQNFENFLEVHLMDIWKEFLPILQDFLPYRGCFPAQMKQ